jgi:hypothetical protein
MLGIFAAVVFIAVATMTWQHLRYLRIRRDSAQDKQRLLHSPDVFHVIVFFKLRTGDKAVDTVRRFLQQILATHRAHLIYAGQAAFTVDSQQLAQRHWDGVLMLEYSSRSDYQEDIANGHVYAARNCFADSYLHGMRRNWQKNIAIPQFLLRRRIKDILSGKWHIEPLEPSPLFATFPEYDIWRGRAARLRAFNQINNNSLVVYSLVKRGNYTQQSDDTLFDRQMGSRMAALGYGPVHMGRPVALEHFARFDQVFVVQYPSAEYTDRVL